MENFELIEKYAAGQLNGPEKEAFELQLQTDTSLQNDVALQKQIIDGIRKARITQLKGMLNQVPVTGIIHSGISATQVITGVVAVSTIVIGTLFYIKPWRKEIAKSLVKIEAPSTPMDKSADTTSVEPKEDKTSSAISEPTKELKKKPVTSKKQNAAKPKIEVVDPTNELTKEPSRELDRSAKSHSVIVTSRIGVEINSSSIKYSFHYQFNLGKLILYGIFDNGLYEILEVNGDSHSVFLYYKDNYYLLNEKQATITPLVAIKDAELISKLKEYRGRR